MRISQMPRPVIENGCTPVLTGAQFTGATLEFLSMVRGGDWSNTSFANATIGFLRAGELEAGSSTMTDATFEDMDLTGCSHWLHGFDMNTVDFVNLDVLSAPNCAIDFTLSTFENVSFQNADLESGILYQADLQTATLTDTNLKSSISRKRI